MTNISITKTAIENKYFQETTITNFSVKPLKLSVPFWLMWKIPLTVTITSSTGSQKVCEIYPSPKMNYSTPLPLNNEQWTLNIMISKRTTLRLKIMHLCTIFIQRNCEATENHLPIIIDSIICSAAPLKVVQQRR